MIVVGLDFVGNNATVLWFDVQFWLQTIHLDSTIQLNLVQNPMVNY